MAEELFDIVDADGNVTGTAPRSVAHRDGLRHRAIHVLFVTPGGDAILQRRSMTKDTYPGYLTVTVGGHVPSGSSYAETVLQEILEETGLRLSANDVTVVGDIAYEYHDPITGAHDNELVRVYGHVFRGKLADLQVEANDGAGFDVYPLAKLRALDTAARESAKIVPMFSAKELYVPLYGRFMELASMEGNQK